MKKLFGKARDGVFEDGHGAHLRVVYGTDQQACQIAVSGKLTSAEVKALFARIVPEKERGKAGFDLEQCSLSDCVETAEYEKVTLSIAVYEADWQVEPLALIDFKRPTCNALPESKKISFRSQSTRDR